MTRAVVFPANVFILPDFVVGGIRDKKLFFPIMTFLLFIFMESKLPKLKTLGAIGASGGNRTHNPIITSDVLCH